MIQKLMGLRYGDDKRAAENPAAPACVDAYSYTVSC